MSKGRAEYGTSRVFTPVTRILVVTKPDAAYFSAAVTVAEE